MTHVFLLLVGFRFRTLELLELLLQRHDLLRQARHLGPERRALVLALALERRHLGAQLVNVLHLSRHLSSQSVDDGRVPGPVQGTS